MMKWTHLAFILAIFAVITACRDDSIIDLSELAWTWIEDDRNELAVEKQVYEEFFGNGNSIRLNQSMCIWQNKAFCFNDGSECKVLDLITKEWLLTDALPEKSHHNNSQFLKTYYDINDKYPLLLLSRGNYPPTQNDVYIVRVQEIDGRITFSIVKTIHPIITEAQYNGSWVIDEEHNKLFLYTMTVGDYRVKDDNNLFCVFSFPLPDILNPEDVSIGYDDVIDKWVYSYLILQGGTYYNGYLFFNVQSMGYYQERSISTGKDVILINTQNGRIEAIMPLSERKETEGLCVYNNKLYVSFKNGSEKQKAKDIVFNIKEYTLPAKIVMK